jgi:hypothetical protein
VSVFENTNVDADTTVRILRFCWFFFAFDSEGSVPFTSSFFLETDLFDRDILRDFAVVTDWNVCKFRE